MVVQIFNANFYVPEVYCFAASGYAWLRRDKGGSQFYVFDPALDCLRALCASFGIHNRRVFFLV
jgi:hypothetical protein